MPPTQIHFNPGDSPATKLGELHENLPLCDKLINQIGNLPFQVQQSQVHGSGLFATKDINAGEEIMRKMPVVRGLVRAALGRICDYCYKENGKDINDDGMPVCICYCYACKLAGWCSKDCQLKAWNQYHQYECAYFVSMPRVPKSNYRLLFRLLSLMINGNVSSQEVTAMSYMHDDYNETLETNERQLHPEIVDYCVNYSGMDDRRVLLLTAKLHANSLPIKVDNVIVGHAFDIIPSIINHSCNPNTIMFVEHSTIRIRTLKQVKAGEELTRCYGWTFYPALYKRILLRDCFYFACNCNRCAELNFPDLESYNDSDYCIRLMRAQQRLSSWVTNGITCGRQNHTVLSMLHRAPKDVFSDGIWPEDIYPKPIINMNIGKYFRDLGKGHKPDAVRYFLRGIACFEPRYAPDWLPYGCILLDMLAALRERAWATRNSKSRKYPTNLELTLVGVGYAQEFAKVANTVFGRDTILAAKLNEEVRKMKAAMIKRLDEAKMEGEFEEMYYAAQGALFIWAGVDLAKRFVLTEETTG